MPFIIAIFLSPLVWSAECNSVPWELIGNFKKDLLEYEAFISSLKMNKNPYQTINSHIEKKGLVLNVALNEKGLKNFPDRAQTESITETQSIFVKKIKSDPSKGLSFDSVYEIESERGEKVINTWNLPFNSVFNSIQGDEVLVNEGLSGYCSEVSYPATLAIKSNGAYRAIPVIALASRKTLNCPMVKKLFSGSDYGGCVEVEDLKTKKKRVFVYQYPMT